MQRIAVAKLKTGMVLARNVYNDDGQKLLSADMTITRSFIRRLIDLKIPAVYVVNPYMEGIDEIPTVSEETRIETIQTVKRAFSIMKSPRSDIPYQEIQGVGKKIVSEVLRNREALLHLNDIKTSDNYTFDHSVNVCIVSVLIAAGMNYPEERMCDLAIGTLMHDVGKTLIDPVILNKPGVLTEEEMTIMKGHAELGFDLLRGSGQGISAPAMHVAFQHHEWFDGGGYPRGLKGNDIHEYARIVAIADVYDAIISDRPYRPAQLPHEAYEIILASNDLHFDPEILPLFLSKIAIYPIGTMVHLNSGDIEVVVDIQPGMTNRPVVRMILDKHGKLYSSQTDLDLREHLTLFVDQVLRDKTIFDLIGKK